MFWICWMTSPHSSSSFCLLSSNNLRARQICSPNRSSSSAWNFSTTLSMAEWKHCAKKLKLSVMNDENTALQTTISAWMSRDCQLTLTKPVSLMPKTLVRMPVIFVFIFSKTASALSQALPSMKRTLPRNFPARPLQNINCLYSLTSFFSTGFSERPCRPKAFSKRTFSTCDFKPPLVCARNFMPQAERTFSQSCARSVQ
ncbi:hypothetical protein [Lysobacter gummosus]|uniref:hypothetical protein n=1 Tax=Lysobacter gummosus TaxID=262324 RepID=UPI0036259FA4